MLSVAEMCRLTGELAQAYQARRSLLASRQAEVQSSLRHRHQLRSMAAAERRTAGNRKRAQLATETAHLLAETRAARQTLSAAQREVLASGRTARQAAVVAHLGEFRRDRAAMAAQQRHALELGRGKLVAEMASFLHEARSSRAGKARWQHAVLDAGAAARRMEVANGLNGLGQARAAMAAAQRDALHQEQTKLAETTSSLLTESRAARRAMASAQRSEIQAASAVRRKEVMASLQGFRNARQALAQEFAESSRVWQDFAGEMQVRRSRAAPSRHALPIETELASAAPGPTAVAEPAEVGPAQEGTGEVPRLPSDDTVFSYLADHPDGVRLVELEDHFAVPRIRLVPSMSRLIEEGRARKDEERKLYFAT